MTMNSSDENEQLAAATGEENADNDGDDVVDGDDDDAVAEATNLTDNDTSVEVSVAFAVAATTNTVHHDQDDATTSNDSERMSNPGDLEALTATSNLEEDCKRTATLCSAAAFAAEAAIAIALATSSDDDDDDDDDSSDEEEENASLAKIHAAAFAAKVDDTQDDKLTNTNCASNNVASQSASVASDNDNNVDESAKKHHNKGMDMDNHNNNSNDKDNDNDKEVPTLGAASSTAAGATLDSYTSSPPASASSETRTVSDGLGLPMTTLTRSVATRIANRAMSLPGAYHVPPSTFATATSDLSSSSSVNVGVLEDESNRGEQPSATTTTSSRRETSSGTNASNNVDNSDSEHAWHAELVVPSITASTTNSSDNSVGNHSSRDLMPEILPQQQVLVVDGKMVSDEADHLQQQKASRRFLILSCLGILFLSSIIVALSLGLSGFFNKNQDNTTLLLEGDQGTSNSIAATTTKAPTSVDANWPVSSSLSSTKKSTLEMIKERGSLRAVVAAGEFDSETVSEQFPFYSDMVRAIAAGVLGPEPQVEFFNSDLLQIFQFVANGTADIMLFGATHTMERDVYMSSVMSSFSFSIPYFYSGIRLAGDPFYVNCIDSNFYHVGECLGLKVCVTGGITTHFKFVAQYIPERNIVPIPWSAGGIFQGLASGKCNVIAEEEHFLSAGVALNLLSSKYNYTGEYVIGQTYLSKEPHAAVSRNDDPKFSSFINVILQGLLAAEHHNITKLTFDAMPQTAVFGEEYQDMLRHAVGTSGNFGEIYERGMKVWTPRTALNEINYGSTGLLYPHPFGSIEGIRDETVPLGNTLTAILQRGRLRCGLRTDRPGFATRLDSTTNTTTNSVGFAGLDVDYCRALSASLFRGDDAAVDFVEVEQASDGFVLLSNDAIDVLAGATLSLETMGHGYSCSQPYFYGYSGEEDNFCLATRMHDSDKDWADLVYWIVTASFYAEDNNIVAATSNDMPEVFVYGREMKRLFRDAILAVGNYAEMYERNVEAFIPRGGRNVLNSFPNIGPQHYIVPGIF